MALREEKKRRTRKAISDLATELFMERGYHAVTTAEIAQKAEVSIGTLFNYFPTKESLVFDDDSEREADLIQSVTGRKKGQTILSALLEAGLQRYDLLRDQRENYRQFMDFIEKTPELSAYWQRMALRHEKALSVVIRQEADENFKVSELEGDAIARTVLNFYSMGFLKPKPKAALKTLFMLLEGGWNG